MSVTENGKERKRKMIASCDFLENELRQYSKEEGVTVADSVDILGVDLRNESQEVGAKELAVRFSTVKKNKALPCSGDGSHGKVEIEDTNVSSSGNKSTTSLSLFMEAYGLEVEEELSTTPLSSGQKETRKWYHEQREAWMRQNSRSAIMEAGKRTCRSTVV